MQIIGKDVELSSREYKLLRKLKLVDSGEINCFFCPYHKGENSNRRNSSKNWKRMFKGRKQYMKNLSGSMG